MELRELVRNLDAAGLRVEVEGPALDAVPSEIVIHPDPATAGAVVLAVGVAPGDLEVLESGAVAVVLRGEVPARTRTRARQRGLTLLSAPPELSWGQLHALLRSASTAPPPDEAGDLFAVADAIAAAVGGPVTIEDPQWRILAFSNLDQPIDEARRQTILGRTPPAEWQQQIADAGLLPALRHGDAPVRFEAPGIAPRVVAAVRAGSELLGSVWVAETVGPIDEEELQRAAQAAAVHLLVHRAAGDVERRHRAAHVRDALAGRHAVERPSRAVCFDGEELERVVSVAGLYFDAAACAVLDNRVWAIAPAGRRVRELAERVVERADRLMGVPLRAAVGAEADLPRSRRTAERALATLDGPGVVVYDEVRATCELDELIELAEREELLAGERIAALAAYDREHRADLCATLRAFLQTREARTAARALGIHPNTLRHRLKRAQEITGLDPSSPDDRLLTELQLRRLSRA